MVQNLEERDVVDRDVVSVADAIDFDNRAFFVSCYVVDDNIGDSGLGSGFLELDVVKGTFSFSKSNQIDVILIFRVVNDVVEQLVLKHIALRDAINIDQSVVFKGETLNEIIPEVE